MIPTPNKEYKVSVRIQVQDGKKTHIRRFKSELEHNGPVDDPKFESRILDEFKAEIAEDANQTTLTEKAPEKKPEAKPAAKK